MGFFSGVTKTLTGGSDSSSSGSSRSGFSLLPTEIQDVYKNYSTDLDTMFSGGAADDLFNPLDVTDYEQSALNAVQQGFTPDQAQLNSDIAMQMNPFDSFVIDEINSQAAGDYSILKQAMNEAGQFGSNRQNIEAASIEENRLDSIGKLKQDQYNTALNNSLTTLSQGRRDDASAGMTAGQFLRDIDFQERQAPVNSMSTFGQLLGVLPSSGGSESTQSSSSSSVGGLGSLF